MSEEHVQESAGAHVHGPNCGHEHSAPVAPAFTSSERAAMHEEDRKAAGNIVLLMLAIFVAGVIGYSIVGYVVSQGF